MERGVTLQASGRLSNYGRVVVIFPRNAAAKSCRSALQKRDARTWRSCKPLAWRAQLSTSRCWSSSRLGISLSLRVRKSLLG